MLISCFFGVLFEMPLEQRLLVGSFSLDKLCLVKCWRRHLGGVRRLA